MTRSPQVFASACLLSVAALQAGELRVCVEDRAGIGAPARAGLARELHALFPKLELTFDDNCDGLTGSDVLLTVLDERPGIPSDALGLAYRAADKILPRLEVFVERVRRLTGAGDWETVGRALARVAAHELLHYRNQTGEHAAHGLMQARLSRAELVSEDLRPRLLASLHHD